MTAARMAVWQTYHEKPGTMPYRTFVQAFNAIPKRQEQTSSGGGGSKDAGPSPFG